LKRLNIFDELSVHYSLSLLRFKDNNTNFLLTFMLLMFLCEVNKNKLKSFLFSTFNSSFLSQEILRMINLSVLGFSKSFLCRGNKNFSFLSEYLLEIYLEDFSLFFNEISLKYNQEFFFTNSAIEVPNLFLSPLKFTKLNLFFNIKKRMIVSLNNLYLTYLPKQTHNVFSFKRHIDLIRYKYNFLIFFSGSRNFSLHIKKKLFSFVKSSLHLDILESATWLLFIFNTF